MRKILAALCALAVLLTGAALAEEPRPLRPGDTIEDFSVTGCDGQTVTLSDLLREKDMVLINLWATWCGPCEREFPAMQAAWEAYRGRAAVLALSVEPRDTDEVLSAYAASHGLTFFVGRDEAGLAARFGRSAIPVSAVIDRSGTVCLIECGAVTDPAVFAAIFGLYTAEDYDGPVLMESAPRARPTAAFEDPAALHEALETEDCANPWNAFAWPMVTGEAEGRSVVMPSNTGERFRTTAEVDVLLSVRAGDAVAVTAKMNTCPARDALILRVNGIDVKRFSGAMNWFTWAVPMAYDAEVTLTLAYDRASGETYADEFLWIDRVAVLSGKEAEAALAANPAYPVADAFSVTPVSPGARELVTGGRDSLHEVLGVSRAYIIPEGEAVFRVEVTADADPDVDFVRTDYDSRPVLLRDILHGGRYEVTLPVTPEGCGGFAVADLLCVVWNEAYGMDGAIWFTGEAEANAFFYDVLPMIGADIWWTYPDGTAPDRDLRPEPAEDEEVTAVSEFTVRCMDRDGAPVGGAIVEIFDGSSRDRTEVPEDGTFILSLPAGPVEMRLLAVPEGYEGDTETVVACPEEGGEIVFTLTKK